MFSQSFNFCLLDFHVGSGKCSSLVFKLTDQFLELGNDFVTGVHNFIDAAVLVSRKALLRAGFLFLADELQLAFLLREFFLEGVLLFVLLLANLINLGVFILLLVDLILSSVHLSLEFLNANSFILKKFIVSVVGFGDLRLVESSEIFKRLRVVLSTEFRTSDSEGKLLNEVRFLFLFPELGAHILQVFLLHEDNHIKHLGAALSILARLSS